MLLENEIKYQQANISDQIELNQSIDHQNFILEKSIAEYSEIILRNNEFIEEINRARKREALKPNRRVDLEKLKTIENLRTLIILRNQQKSRSIENNSDISNKLEKAKLKEMQFLKEIQSENIETSQRIKAFESELDELMQNEIELDKKLVNLQKPEMDIDSTTRNSEMNLLGLLFGSLSLLLNRKTVLHLVWLISWAFLTNWIFKSFFLPFNII